MRLLSDPVARVVPVARPVDEQDLCRRVLAEFKEMPGLILTLSQAAWLFNIERDRCARIFGSLVAAGHLVTDGRTFARPGAGRRYA